MLFRRRPADRPVSRMGVDTAPEVLPLLGLDHIELYVGNPQHTARLLTALGFEVVASQGRHSGVQDLDSYVLRQGTATLLVTGGTTARQDAVVHVAAKGDSVKDVAFSVTNADAAYGTCIRNEVEPEHLPVEYRDDDGDLALCPVASPAGVLHTLVQRDGYDGVFCPGFATRHDVPVPADAKDAESLVTSVDSVTFVIRPQTLDEVTDHYRRLYGMTVAEEETLESGTAPDLARLRVLRRDDADITLVLVEPADRRERTHLDEFLRLHGGPGVHILSLRSPDIERAAAHLIAEGLRVQPAAPDQDLPVSAPDGAMTVEDRDGTRVRSLTVGPLQHRAPLLVEIVERDTAGPLPLQARRHHHAQLAAVAHRERDHQILNTWEAGR